jgi:indole-3-glycerol phosphate synthase
MKLQRRFSEALLSARISGWNPLISEIKCISPKEGDLLRGRNPVDLARAMHSAGATCISVVTEPNHFGGSLQLLRDIAVNVSLPVLRKDFVKNIEDVRATRAAGASCLLLTVAMLDWKLLAELHRQAHDEGMETLVEVHNEVEIERALTLDLDLLGINNRDILQLERDDGTISKTLELVRAVPRDIRVISESAICNLMDIRMVLESGAAGVLVGTAILQADDLVAAVRQFSGISD